MTKQRWLELMNDLTLGLTESEITQGWHFCLDWDGLLIGPGSRELDCCTCE